MAQHLLLGDVAPLLLVLGLSGPLKLFVLPPGVLRPLARSPLRRLGRLVLQTGGRGGPVGRRRSTPGTCPPLYEAALASPALHGLEHASFLVAGLLVWSVLLDGARSAGRRAAFAAAVLVAGVPLAELLLGDRADLPALRRARRPTARPLRGGGPGPRRPDDDGRADRHARHRRGALAGAATRSGCSTSRRAADDRRRHRHHPSRAPPARNSRPRVRPRRRNGFPTRDRGRAGAAQHDGRRASVAARRNCWRPVAGPWRAHVGRNGLSSKHREGDATTPVGSFGIEPTVYGVGAEPGRALPLPAARLRRLVGRGSRFAHVQPLPARGLWDSAALRRGERPALALAAGLPPLRGARLQHAADGSGSWVGDLHPRGRRRADERLREPARAPARAAAPLAAARRATDRRIRVTPGSTS